MKLSFKADYSLRILIYVQKHKTRVKIQDIADAYHVSKNHLSVVVNTLTELGYLTSTSGPKGGIEFNEKFSDHTVYELLKEVESFNLVECFDPKTNKCSLSDNCKLKNILKKANNAFIKELQNYKIKDLV